MTNLSHAGFAYSPLVAAFARTSILVIGDVMLDEYIWGEVRRISPEAPVPVVNTLRRTYAPGGAANVAANIAAMGGQALLGGVIGNDYSAIQLRAVLDLPRMDISGFVTEAARPTTTKTRIVAHSQQVVRVDSEQRHTIPPAETALLLAWFDTHIAQAGAVVLSDYNKGVVSPDVAQYILQAARRQGKPVIVDPKGTDYAKYQGASLIKPNLHEAERAANREIRDENELLEVAQHLSCVLEGGAVLITRGAEGMSLFVQDQAPVHIPQVARAVYDVTGAGDTVVSTLALALAGGASLEQAARLANLAGGLVVSKLGTASVTAAELLQELN